MTSLSWDKGLHHPCGNIGLGDGSVQFFDANRLATAAQHQEEETNRLAIP
jgi:hypothetical protein